jgi:AraC-like DNA-binding protein
MNQPETRASSQPEATHPGKGVVALASTLQELGHDPVPLLQQCGLPADLAGNSWRVPVENELAFIREALRVSGRPDLGLLAGSRHRVPESGFWGLALAASPTLGSAVRVGLLSIDRAHSLLRWSFAQVGEEVELVMRPAFPLGELEPFVVERDAVAMAALLNDLTGREDCIAGVSFAYPRPGWADRYADAFRCEVSFAHDRHALRVEAPALDQPLAGSDSMAAAAAEEQCQRLLATLPPAGGLVARLRHFLLAEPGRLPGQDEAARYLGLSRRTLRRRLAEEGVGFRAIVDEIRCTLVTGYLEHTALSLDEIATRCGFSDAANLSHAFRRWTGKAPGAWRQQRRSGPG